MKVNDRSGHYIIFTKQIYNPGYCRTIGDAKEEAGRVLSAGINFSTFTVGIHGAHDCTIVNRAVFTGT